MAGITPSGLGGKPIAKVDRYSGTDEEYQEVVKWTVTKGKRGEFKEVSMVTDDYANTHFRLTIAGEKQFEDVLIQAPLTLSFRINDLPAESAVLLECKRRVAGAAITVDGSITGREI